ITVTTGVMSRSVGVGGSPSHEVFNLQFGNHQLLVRSREPNTQLRPITISPVGAQLDLVPLSVGLVSLNGFGLVGRSYYVQATTDLIHWNTIGTTVADDAGAFSFIDSNARAFAARYYRLRDRTLFPVQVQLQIRKLPD